MRLGQSKDGKILTYSAWRAFLEVSIHGRRVVWHAMCISLREKVEDMKSTDGCIVKKTFLNIPNAAELAGFSVRHFRRIVEQDRIRIVFLTM